MATTLSIPILRYTGKSGSKILATLTSSAHKSETEALATVETILEDLKKRGDTALFEYTRKFDKVSLTASTVRVGDDRISEQAKKASAPLKKAVREAARRIKAYHAHQKQKGYSLKTSEGTLAMRIQPLSRVGVYIPGGYAAYPSTVLMNVIPARLAGVKEIVAVTPPQKEFHPATAYALQLLKVKEVYQIGGAQAVGALAYGTQTIRPVEKIVGPGNLYVALAKRCVYGAVDIDTIAGPSEVIILADSSANPSWVALDLLAQAEHGSGDEVAFCITENSRFADRIKKCLLEEVKKSPVAHQFDNLSSNALSLVVTRSRKESIDLINQCAPEHLQIMTKDPAKDAKSVMNAGAIFLGPYTPAALGDYFIGTNHVLPTGGAARFGSPLGVDSFVKHISIARVTAKGLEKAAKHVSVFARSERLVHHALSVERRQ
ncbi:MAG: histidinol dehydrogenase [Chitinivibrionales bacterium]|nr:histidinol dehydrogenase [Chitinivibrionales bacterium]